MRNKNLLNLFVIASAICFLNYACQKSNSDSDANDVYEIVSKKKQNLRVPEYCENLSNPCSDPACAPYYNCNGSDANDINDFRNSADFSSFSTFNPNIKNKIKFNAASVIVQYDPLQYQNLKAIVFPVVESGDTSGLVYGIKNDVDGVTNYLIFYQNNASILKNSNGNCYGEIGIDLYNSDVSFTIWVNSNLEKTSDTVISGPRWINNEQISTARRVWPTAECITQTVRNFNNGCTGWCEWMCNISNFGTKIGLCYLGTSLGAAVWCANHNNKAGTFGAE